MVALRPPALSDAPFLEIQRPGMMRRRLRNRKLIVSCRCRCFCFAFYGVNGVSPFHSITDSLLFGVVKCHYETLAAEVLQLCSHPVVGWQHAPRIFGFGSIQVATI